MMIAEVEDGEYCTRICFADIIGDGSKIFVMVVAEVENGK